jgi:hypothetical protein
LLDPLREIFDRVTIPEDGIDPLVLEPIGQLSEYRAGARIRIGLSSRIHSTSAAAAIERVLPRPPPRATPLASSAAASAIASSLRPATLPTHARAALLVSADPLFISRRLQLAMLAVKHTVPAIFPFREQADGGGLMSYGTSRATFIVVPVASSRARSPPTCQLCSQPNSSFIINLQTATALGILIPPTLLARADEVIEQGCLCCSA